MCATVIWVSQNQPEQITIDFQRLIYLQPKY